VIGKTNPVGMGAVEQSYEFLFKLVVLRVTETRKL
jgi:hypothetical protein